MKTINLNTSGGRLFLMLLLDPERVLQDSAVNTFLELWREGYRLAA